MKLSHAPQANVRAAGRTPIFIFTFISFRAVGFCVSHTARAGDSHFHGSSHFNLRFLHAMPLVWHTWNQKFHPIFVFIIIIINIILFHACQS